MSILEVKKFSVSLGGRDVIRNASFTADGGLTLLLGRNGCGKSTLIRALIGLIPAKGTIILDGKDISSLPAGKRAAYFSYLPQRQTIPEGLTVLEYTALGSYAQRQFGRPPGKADREAALRELERTGIAHLAERYVSRISGGEARLAALARARMQKCGLMLMDEPLAGLDYVRQHEFMARVRSEGTPMLMSLHDPAIAWQYADRLLIMDSGGITTFTRDDEQAFEIKLREIYGAQLGFEQAGGIRLPIWHDR